MPTDSDSFRGFTPTPAGPFRRAVVPAKSDTEDLPNVTCALYVGDDGKDVRVILQNDASAVTFSAVRAGTLLPVRARRVLATGTTSTALVALY